MLFEILKNSLRATVETHGADCEDFPPIKVIVAEGSDDITIKISDEVRHALRHVSDSSCLLTDERCWRLSCL